MKILTWRQVCCGLGVFTRSVRNDFIAGIKSAVTELCSGGRGVSGAGAGAVTAGHWWLQWPPGSPELLLASLEGTSLSPALGQHLQQVWGSPSTKLGAEESRMLQLWGLGLAWESGPAVTHLGVGSGTSPQSGGEGMREKVGLSHGGVQHFCDR